MHRTVKDGLGAAYLAGFAWGLNREYTALVEMDADGSHAPEQLYLLLEAIENGADLAIGSRYVEGGSVQNWPWRRWAAVLDGQHLLATGAGRRRPRHHRRLPRLPSGSPAEDRPGHVDSKGYCFQIDLTWRTINNGFVVVEVPITFIERELGVSKMSGSNIREAMVKVAQWGVDGRLDRAPGR